MNWRTDTEGLQPLASTGTETSTLFSGAEAFMYKTCGDKHAESSTVSAVHQQAVCSPGDNAWGQGRGSGHGEKFERGCLVPFAEQRPHETPPIRPIHSLQ